VTYWALKEEGRDYGLPQDNYEKVDVVLDAGPSALEQAASANVRIVYGSDLLGGMHRHQAYEFALRAQVQPAVDVLRSATTVAADLLGMSGEIGVVQPGAHADFVVVDGDPLEDVAVLADPAANLRVVVQGGRVVVNRR
jgi:imidazolonepropionase-like amidohydrolase